MLRPRPTLEFRRGDVLVTSVVVHAEADWFAGHFSGRPLFPGVAMLALVEESIELFWPSRGEGALEVTAFERIRFRQMVGPGATLRVRVHRRQPDRLHFAVESDGRTACTGACSVRAVVAPAARAPSADTGEAGNAFAAGDPPWAHRTSAAFSPDGLTVGGIVGRALQLAGAVRDSERLRLCVASEDRAEVAAALLAAFGAGIHVVFPAALSPDGLASAWRARSFSHWLGPADWRERLPELDAAHVAPAWPGPSLQGLRVAHGDPCVFLQTGGTTGRPRLCAKSARHLLAEAVFHAHALQIEAGDHIVATAAPFHMYGLLFSVLLPLVSHATVERTSPFFPQEIAQRLEASRATILVSTPAHLRALVGCMPSRHRLRLVLSSGAPLAAADAADVHARTGVWPLEVYGSTETGGIAVRRQDVADAPWLPLAAVDVRADGETLWVRSPFVSPNACGDDAFLTGDRADILADGTFRLLGRVDGVVKVGGKRVVLAEVEDVLRSLAGVRDAVVLALPLTSGRGQELVALAACDRPAAELARELREKLPSPAWPRRLRCAAAIPLTAVGKRDRDAILQCLASSPADEP